MSRTTIPASTYRVQFNKDFRFLDCRDIVPYLYTLGIGALYSSPRFRARRGSDHGYDVASPLRVNSELGTDEEFDELCAKLRTYQLGLVLDIVPNHMAASHENPWWMDVLENGPSSPYAHYFDIDWHPVVSKAAFLQDDKVLLPILGDLYGNILERRELSLGIDETGFFLRYYERKIPLDPASYGGILDVCLERVLKEYPEQREATAELEEIRSLVRAIPPSAVIDPEQIAIRLNEGRSVKTQIFALYRDHLEARLSIESALRQIGEEPGRLHELLEKQAFRLAFWKMALEEINYRRFFDINDLVCIRVEAADVFEARHKVIFQLVAEEKVTGLRVDHIDGLYDPEAYLERLHAASAGAAPDRPVYVVIEKILGREEQLPGDWKTCGTTGYDFLNAINGIFVDNEGLRAIEAFYARFTGENLPFAEICYQRNKQVMQELFAAEVQMLGHHLGKLAARDWQGRDVPLSELTAAMVETTACLPVYRTYLRSFEVSHPDRKILAESLQSARGRTSSEEIGDPAFEFLRRVLLLQPASGDEKTQADYLKFVMRWQQFTGPVMAKGLEDTAGYVHNSLISINEVGGDSLRQKPPIDVGEFHRFQKLRSRHWPHTMNATSTHDTKRSEDVRARINVLSELPGEWEKCLVRWNRLNRGHKATVEGIEVPTPGEESLLYQTLLGAWPLDPADEPGFPERVQEFLTKAVREAKMHSGWIRQNPAHEEALLRFAKEIIQPEADAFRKDFLRFQRKIAWHGALNSLSQLLIKITSPGVADFYQGSEIWDFSMVDPDNRRPVDFQKRIQMLDDLRRDLSARPRRLLQDIQSHWQDGRIKLFVTDRALDFRRVHADLYCYGEYTPIDAAGVRSANVCAFARHKEGQWCLTVAPRLTTHLAPSGRMPLGELWQDTAMLLPPNAPAQWCDAFTGESIALGESADGTRTLLLSRLLKRFPLALLASVP